MTQATLSRGTWVGIYRNHFTTKGFQKLSANARLVYVCLRLNTSGAAGIDSQYRGELEEAICGDSGFTRTRVRRCLQELEEAGLLEWEDNVVWVVDHLQQDPNLWSGNEKHRTNIQRFVAAFPDVPIVQRFKARYPEWFNEPPLRDAPSLTQPTGTLYPSDTVSLPLRYPIDTPSNQKRQETRDKEKETTSAEISEKSAADKTAGGEVPYSQFSMLWNEYPHPDETITRGQGLCRFRDRRETTAYVLLADAVAGYKSFVTQNPSTKALNWNEFFAASGGWTKDWVVEQPGLTSPLSGPVDRELDDFMSGLYHDFAEDEGDDLGF